MICDVCGTPAPAIRRPRSLPGGVAAQGAPVEQQAQALAKKARDAIARASRQETSNQTQDMLYALSTLADAIDVLAGTAPEEG